MSRLFILGAGNPTPAPHRFGSSYVLQIGDEYLMFDCGPATTYKLVNMGMSPTQIDNLFFTHHHFDHDVDYPCFLLTRWDSGSSHENRLSVYGPKLTEQLTERILDEQVGAYAHDWIARINHPLSLGAYMSRGGVLPRVPPSLDAKDIGPGPVTHGKDWDVVCAPAEHVQPWLDSLAYRVDSSEGSFVFTGDTRPCRTVAELAKGTDTLVVACVGIDEEIKDMEESNYMCGTTGAGEMAREAGAKRLVLVHNTRISDHGIMERAIADVARVYDGEIIMSEELMEVPL
jgi:ribonuclease BN (tRNA processing enzyme)